MCRGETSHVCHATPARRRNVNLTAKGNEPSEASGATGAATVGATGAGARTNVGYALHYLLHYLCSPT